jgi:TPR repeat protein
MRLVHLGMKYGLVDLAARLGRTGWALRFARPLLEQQDAPTQWYVGLMYHTGFGVEKDLTIALQFYERSAAQDFSPACAGLLDLDREERAAGSGDGSDACGAVSFYRARFHPDRVLGMAQDCEMAFREILKDVAADRGEEQILVGMCFEVGIQFKANHDTALEWYRRAATGGIEAAYELYESLSSEIEGEDGTWDRLETKVVSILARSRQQDGVEPRYPQEAIAWRLTTASKGDR